MTTETMTAPFGTFWRSSTNQRRHQAGEKHPDEKRARSEQLSMGRDASWLLRAPLVIFAPAVAALLLAGLSPLGEQAQSLQRAETQLNAAYVNWLQQPAEPSYEVSRGLMPQLEQLSRRGIESPARRAPALRPELPHG